MSEMTEYQAFIHTSRYARFLPEAGRRETWHETITRYLDYMFMMVERDYSYKPGTALYDELYKAIHDLEVMPSMRAMMSAGPALDRCHIAGYNCSFSPANSVDSFAEFLFILMNGTGVGFSVERQFIQNIPAIPETIAKTADEIVVGDSKEGWAQAYKEYIYALFSGSQPKVNTSLVRPAGSPLITFGGRASGPEPFMDLIDFTARIFHGAKGRRLNSLEVHDIVCYIGRVVVVGGVRRSALISLSNLSDDRMRKCKSGDWQETESQRFLANNSVAYTEKPEVGSFMQEWLALYESKSGERGIFNRAGTIEKVKSLARRNPNYDFGTNPCGEIVLRPNGLCNLSEVVVRAGNNLSDLKEKVRLSTIIGTFQACLTKFEFVGPEWKKNAEEERLLGVSLTGICDHELLNGGQGNAALVKHLNGMRKEALKTNAVYARDIGINVSAAITTVKPSGTVSQLVDSASGIHPRHSGNYIRTVRGDNKDPLTIFMKDAGFPVEPGYMSEQTTSVFSFPQQAPTGAITRDDITAIEHLELVKTYNQHWSEHAVSCTITVKEGEWPSVGGWVYDNFDSLAGVSFLPHSDHVYRQAPYQEINMLEYQVLMAKMPKGVNWEDLRFYEGGVDNTTGTQELNCSAGACEVVSFGASQGL